MDFREQVLVSGHRGNRVHGNENTLSALRLAAEAGADLIEFDIRMTRDGALVLMHDETVDRTTDGTGKVSELSLAQLRSLNAAVHSDTGRSEPPAALEEVLELAREFPKLLLLAELKDDPTPGNEPFAFACAEKAAEALLAHGLGERTWIVSFSGKLLEFVYHRFGTRLHYHGFYPWFIMGEMTTDPERFIDVACMQHRERLADGTVVKCAEALCPKEWFDHLLEKGIMPLMAPSLREYPKYDLAFSWGSRIVNSDDPCGMLTHLRAAGLHT